MGKYEEIKKAREILGIPEESTIEDIKRNYRILLKKWHPDRKSNNVEECTDMVRKIIEAYKILMEYCSNYKISFSKQDICKNLSDKEWWLERFGEDPIWSRKK